MLHVTPPPLQKPRPVCCLKLVRKMEKSRKGLLTRLEYAILAVLNKARTPLEQKEIERQLRTIADGKTTANYYRQMEYLKGLGCIKKIDNEELPYTFQITEKGRTVLTSAAQLVLAMES